MTINVAIYFSIIICIILVIYLYIIKYFSKYNIFIYLFWLILLLFVLYINLNLNTIEHLDINTDRIIGDGICTTTINGKARFGIISAEYGKCIVDKDTLDNIKTSQMSQISDKNNIKCNKSPNKTANNENNSDKNNLDKNNNGKPGLASDTNCYDINTDFDKKCNIEVGKLYGLKEKVKTGCDKNQMRGKCAIGYINGHKIPEGNVTQCLPLTDDFNYICKDLFSDQHGIKSLDYKTCPKGYARGICETNYKNEVPLYGTSTKCYKWDTDFHNECKNAYGNDYILIDKDGLNCLPNQGRGICSKIYRNINIDGKIIEIYNKYNCPLYLDESNAIFDCKYYPSKIMVNKVDNNYILSSYINHKIYYITIDTSDESNQITVKNDITLGINHLFDITQNSNNTYNIAHIAENGDYCYIDGINNTISYNKAYEYTELIINIVG